MRADTGDHFILERCVWRWGFDFLFKALRLQWKKPCNSSFTGSVPVLYSLNHLPHNTWCLRQGGSCSHARSKVLWESHLRPMTLKLQHSSESPGGFAKPQIAGPTPWEVWAGTPGFAFLTSSQAMLLLLDHTLRTMALGETHLSFLTFQPDFLPSHTFFWL